MARHDYELKQREENMISILAEDVFASFPKNRDIALRVAGCCLCLNRIEEGNYLLNPQELYQEEKDKFLILFPEFKSHLSKV